MANKSEQSVLSEHPWIQELVAQLPTLSTSNELLPVLRIGRRRLTELVAQGLIRPLQHTNERGSKLLFPRHEIARYLNALESSRA